MYIKLLASDCQIVIYNSIAMQRSYALYSSVATILQNNFMGIWPVTIHNCFQSDHHNYVGS